ncbi:putative short-chain dehydrogenase [Astrocystis sublimbata]|nr:putative short-chain dehydrogenase [Astrocystis sublimbata]
MSIMSVTTHSEFNEHTEALQVAEAFQEGVRGKTILVTGGNVEGIGFATCQAFASRSPAHLIIAGRTPSKVARCIETLKSQYPGVDYRPLIVDLSSQDSVRAAAAELLSWADVPALNIIVNSAGVMGINERTLSVDGIEMHFATNHIGHWLLTCSLMPKLIKAAESSSRGATRIVNVSSASPFFGATMRWSDMNFDKPTKDLPAAEQPNENFIERWGYKDLDNTSYIPLEGYNVSKVANVLFGVGANRRLYEKYGILTLALHPGVIPTELGRNFPPEILAAAMAMADQGLFVHRTLGAGAATSLVAALDPKLGPGVFMDACQVSKQPLCESISSDSGERLWKLSEELVKENFEF